MSVSGTLRALPPILSHFQATTILHARRANTAEAGVSLDLGMTSATVRLSTEGVDLADGSRLSWEQVEQIESSETACYQIIDNAPVAIKAFSHDFGRAYSLMPTEGAPALIMAGFPMHRFKGIDPREAARAMADAAGPLRGKVLDTATGLGYSAIRAAETAEQVTTIELDPVAQEIARCNPWSRPLFEDSRIRQLIGDSSELVGTMGDAAFSAVIHDPPTVSLAGDLYAGSFYAQIRRVLKPGGRVFHYIGDPDSASGGRVTKGVVRRLYDAGFARVVPVAKAFGVVAVK